MPDFETEVFSESFLVLSELNVIFLVGPQHKKKLDQHLKNSASNERMREYTVVFSKLL